MIHTKVLNKIPVQTFRCTLYRFLHSQNINRNIFISINFNHVHENYRNNYSSKNVFRKNLYCSSLNNPFQRNISINTNQTNEAVFKTNIDTFSTAVENDEITKTLASQTPDLVLQMSEWKIVELAQNSLLELHSATGLPWWASITLAAFLTRTITLPFVFIQIRNSSKLELIKLEMTDFVQNLKRELNHACTYHAWPEKLAKQKFKIEVKKEMNRLIVRDNCHPGKSFVFLLVQLPLWISFSFATRNLCYMLPKGDFSAQLTYVEMMDGGFAWITNLTLPDSYLILPVALGLFNLLIIEAHNLFKTLPPTKFERLRNIILRIWSVFMIGISANVPVAMNMFWLTSSSFALIQIFLTHSTRVRRFLRVPMLEADLQHPYRHFYSNLKSKLRLVKNGINVNK